MLEFLCSAPPTLSGIIKPGENTEAGASLCCPARAMGGHGAFRSLQKLSVKHREFDLKRGWGAQMTAAFSYKPFHMIIIF